MTVHLRLSIAKEEKFILPAVLISSELALLLRSVEKTSGSHGDHKAKGGKVRNQARRPNTSFKGAPLCPNFLLPYFISVEFYLLPIAPQISNRAFGRYNL